MKKKFRLKHKIFTGLFFLLLLGGVLFWTRIANASIGNLQIFKGDAQVLRNGAVSEGTTGFGVMLHDVLKISPTSRVAIVLKDNTVVRIEEGSEVEVANIAYEGGKIKDAEFRLKAGRLWVRSAPIAQNGSLNIETPTVTASVRGTSFNTTYKQGITGIFVYKHQVSVKLLKNNQEQTVEKGNLLQMRETSLEDDFAKGSFIPPDPFFDEWIKFNEAQDDALCQTIYVPDCDENGSQLNSPTPAASTSSPSPSPTPRKLFYTPKPTPKPTATPTPSPTPTSTPTPTPSKTPSPSPTYSPSPSPTLSSLRLQSDKSSMFIGQTATMTVIGTYTDGSTTNVSSDAGFKQNPTLGTFSKNIFTAQESGTTIITATLNNKTSNGITIQISQQIF